MQTSNKPQNNFWTLLQLWVSDMGVAHVVTPGSPRPCHQPNRNPLHPDPGDDAGYGNDDDDGDEGTLP